MARPRQLSDRFKGTDFKDLLRKSQGSEKQRYLGLYHVQQGKIYEEVAEMLLVSRQTVMEWVKRFEENKEEGLADLPGRGRKARVPVASQEAFQAAVEALQEERGGGRVKGGDILKMAKEKFGAEYTLSGLYKLLSRMKIVWITGRSIHPKGDEAAQEDFKKTLPSS
jgi:transposase